MNEVPPNGDEFEDVDEHYRRASAGEQSRPSDAVRRAVLDHAARVAAQRAPENVRELVDFKQPAANRPRWRSAIFGTAAAAALAGLLVVPRFLGPHAPGVAAVPPAQKAEVAGREVAASPAPQAPAMAPTDASGARAKTAPPGAAAARSATAGAAGPAANTVAAALAISPSGALRRAAEAGDVAAVRDWLGKGSDVNGRDGGGRTALMLATLGGRTEAVEVLLAAGADPNAADAHGATPLQVAVAGKQPVIAAALRRAGAGAGRGAD